MQTRSKQLATALRPFLQAKQSYTAATPFTQFPISKLQNKSARKQQQHQYSSNKESSQDESNNSNSEKTTHKKKKRKFLRNGFLLTTAALAITYEIYSRHSLSDPRHPYYPYIKTTLVPFFQFCEGTVRFMRTFITCIRVAAEYKYYEHTLSPEEYAVKRKEIHSASAQRFLKLFCKNAGIYIKFGQYMSTMNNFLDPEWTEPMKVLQDKAPFVDYDEVNKMFYLDFGKTIEEVFLEFDKKPVAAASLAQVHRAKLHNGQEVAVKVQYPTVRYFFQADLFARDKVLEVVQYMFPQYNFTWIGPEFTEALKKELDFVTEKNNARRVESFYKGRRNDVHVPQVFDDYSSERFLTMEYIHGVKINDREGIERMGFSVAKSAHIALEAFAEQLFLYGFVNCDGHPGNIFVRPSPTNPKKEQVVLLDHGLYKEFGEEFRVEFCKFWKAMILKDDERVKEYCEKIGVKDYKFYASLVLMRGYDDSGVGMGGHGTLEGWNRFKKQFEEIDFATIFNNLPTEMLLLMRTFNLLRSINQELGVPVNRYVINARVAAKGIHFKEENMSLREKIAMAWDKFKFEMVLAYNVAKHWMMIQAYQLAIHMGWIKPMRLRINKEDVDVVLSA